MSYGDAFCEVYDTLYPPDRLTGVSVQRLASLAETGPILELGVGTGRIALPLAARMPPGTVWGIDSSKAMLERLASKDPGRTIRAFNTDMSEINLPAGTPQFSLIVAAFNTFYLLADTRSKVACLRRSHELLAPGGRLVLELYRFARQGPNQSQWSHTERTVDGRTAIVTYKRSRSDHHLFIGRAQIDGVPTATWTMRPLPTATLDAIVAAAGFELVSRRASWSGGHYFESIGHHVSVWRRRAPASNEPASASDQGTRASSVRSSDLGCQ